MPLVSVITPSYNSKDYLADTVNSVLAQNYSNIEIIVIDDNSMDGSDKIIKKLASTDKRVKTIFLDKNKGAGVARNCGIEICKGKYISFLDSDDLWHPDKIKKQILFMQENKRHLTYTNYYKIDESGKVLSKAILPLKSNYRTMLRSNFMPCLTVAYDAEHFGKQYFPEIRKRQDYALWLNMLKKVDYAYCLPDHLAYYRTRNKSISSNKLSLLKYNWDVFYSYEKLGILKSLCCLTCNIVFKFLRKA